MAHSSSFQVQDVCQLSPMICLNVDFPIPSIMGELRHNFLTFMVIQKFRLEIAVHHPIFKGISN